MQSKINGHKKIRTNVRCGVSSESDSAVLNNPLYEAKGTAGANPLFGG